MMLRIGKGFQLDRHNKGKTTSYIQSSMSNDTIFPYFILNDSNNSAPERELC